MNDQVLENTSTDVAAFREHLERVRRQIDKQRTAPSSDDDAAADQVALVVDLETVYEELRVAEEEVRTQASQIAQLVDDQRLSRWQHERLMGILPVAVVITDRSGVIGSVNAVAAVQLGMRVAAMLGKPLMTFFDPADRPRLRRSLSGLAAAAAAASPSEQVRAERWSTTLVRRDQPPVSVEATVTPTVDRKQLTWMLLPGGGSGPSSGGVNGGALAQALTDLTVLATATEGLQALLFGVAGICRRALGAGVEVSVTVGSPSSPEATAATSSWAQELDGVQLYCEEGPCVAAFETLATVVTADVRSDQRWPRLAARLPAEVGAVMAVPLEVGDRLVGALNVYRTTTGLDPELVEAVELLGATIAALLYERSVRGELRSLASDMERALASRAVIDQAKGIVMAEHGYTPDQAFTHLTDLSSRHGIKVRDLARQIVERASSRA